MKKRLRNSSLHLGHQRAHARLPCWDGLKKKKANAIQLSVHRIVIDKLLESLYDAGIPKQKDELQELQNTWLLLDDAQSAYTDEYQVFLEIVIKDIACAKGLFVVIASTYSTTLLRLNAL